MTSIEEDPALDPEADGSVLPPDVEPGAGLGVLVVEDHAATRQLLVAHLRRLGHEPEAFGDGAAALAAFRPEQHLLVLLDLILPGLDGVEVCRRLRAAPGGEAPVILVLTGRTAEADLEQVLGAGADDYMHKPIDSRQLRTRLRIAERRARIRVDRRRIDEQLRWLQKAVETMQIGVTITDLERRILYTNPADARMHGYGVEELTGQDVGILAPRESWNRGLTRQHLARFNAWKRESVNLRKDGTSFPVQITSDVVSDAAGQPVGIVTCCEDITERRRAERALRASEERYALAARGSNDGLWDWHIETDEIHFSERWKAILGYPEHDISRRPAEWLDRVHPADRERLQSALDQHLTGKAPHLECSHRLLHSDGSYRWVLVRGLAVRGANGKPQRMAGSLTDLTERGVHDELTGLPNRVLFDDRLRAAAARHRRTPERSYAVLLVDLDRFKIVNEGMGPVLGDRLLVDVARRLEGQVRASDALARADATLARANGDEFLLLLEDLADAADALRVAERIQGALQEPFELEGREVFTTASVGIALCRGSDGSQDLVREAGIALNRAKTQGTSLIRVFDPAMQKRAGARLQIESELRRALERGELRAVYQPILSLATGDIVGCEALVRWQHPDQGLVSPATFVPVAEESGLIVALDFWVLEEACGQLMRWERELGRSVSPSVNVNLSSRHFARGGLLDHVRETLRRTGCPGSRLKLEITESSLMENPAFAAETLSELKALGIRICVDDFGTGYSSLSYLHRFPLDVIKIDRAFVKELGERDKPPAIISAIVSLAEHLGMETVAEGVETERQLAQLKEIGCGYGQGYLFSKPIGHEEAQRVFVGAPWRACFAAADALPRV